MKEHYFLNGNPVDINFPLRAMFFGDGVFETFRCKGKLPAHIGKHLARLKKGAELLSIPFPDENETVEKIEHAYNSSGITDTYMKVCLLPEGDNTFFTKPTGVSVLIVTKECPVSKDEVDICVSSHKRNQNSVLNSVKSMNYLENILVKREAVDRGFDDAIILNLNNNITETSSCNIFWTRGKGVYTPSVQCGLLPGITREIILEVMAGLDYQIFEHRFGLSYMLNSDFVFLTNSVSGMMFVNKINDLKLPKMDNNYSRIRDRFLKLMDW